ncbi:hypothetical protein ACJBU6_11325 [Exserohilum turcicum]
MRKYMSKSQRACDHCRARKSACRIDSVPPCRLCHLSRRECTFEAASKITRASAPSATHLSPTNSLQDSASLVAAGQQNDGVGSNNAFLDEQGHLFPRQLPDSSADFWLDQAMIDINAHDFNCISTPPNEKSMDNLRLSSSSAQGLETASIVCGLTGDMDPYLMQKYNFGLDNNFVFKRLTVRSMTQDIHPVQLLVSNITDPMEQSDKDGHSYREQLERLVTHDVGVRLVSLFFRFVYPHFPILPQEQSTEPGRSNPSTLAAIYLVTLPFASFDDYLSVQIAYDLPYTEKLWDLALEVVHRELHKPDFSTLQTLILLLVSPPHKPLMPEYSTKWSLVGIMVAVSQTLGLHFDPTSWDILPAEVQLRKRLSWAVKMIDVWHAAVLGRSCLIHDEEWPVPPPFLSDFSQQECEATFPAHFIHMYKLTDILHTVLTTLFALKAVQTLARDYEDTLRKAQTLMEEMNRWSSAATDMQGESQAEDIDPSGPLLLGGHFVKVLLFRAILRPFSCLRYSAESDGSVDKHRELEARRLSRAGAKACVISFVAFTSNVKSNCIHGFWPFCK